MFPFAGQEIFLASGCAVNPTVSLPAGRPSARALNSFCGKSVDGSAPAPPSVPTPTTDPIHWPDPIRQAGHMRPVHSALPEFHAAGQLSSDCTGKTPLRGNYNRQFVCRCCSFHRQKPTTFTICSTSGAPWNAYVELNHCGFLSV